MDKSSLYRSIFALALCGAAPACTSPVTDSDNAQPPGDAVGAVHQTPKVPVMIDGIRYAAEDIHQFDGRPLYMFVDLAQPDLLVGYTKRSDFQAAADAAKAARGSSTSSQFAPGEYADYFSGDECTGDKLTVYAGWGVNDLRAVSRGCSIFGCAGDWNDVISSVWVNGYETLYSDIYYSGSSFSAWGTGCFNMSTYSFDNIGSSLNVW